MTRAKRWFGGAVTIAASVWIGTAIPQGGSPAPVRLDRDKIAGLNLTGIPPDAYQQILVAGELNMRVASLFEGKELRVSIYSLVLPLGYTGTWEMLGNYREIAILAQR
jgi:hypothetical protein